MKINPPVFIHAGAEVLVPIVDSRNPLLDGAGMEVSLIYQAVGQRPQQLHSLPGFLQNGRGPHEDCSRVQECLYLPWQCLWTHCAPWVTAPSQPDCFPHGCECSGRALQFLWSISKPAGPTSPTRQTAGTGLAASFCLPSARALSFPVPAADPVLLQYLISLSVCDASYFHLTFFAVSDTDMACFWDWKLLVKWDTPHCAIMQEQNYCGTIALDRAWMNIREDEKLKEVWLVAILNKIWSSKLI